MKAFLNPVDKPTDIDLESPMTNENENPVLQVLDAYKAAVLGKDLDAFMAIYDQNIEVFDMWGPPWIYQGTQSWRSMAEEWFRSLNDERVVVDMENVQIELTAQMAFVSAFVKYTAISSDGTPLRWLQNRMTCVLEPKDGRWKITHEHTSAPVDHNTLKVSLKR
jgi:ketosteroid isomerase-like protein